MKVVREYITEYKLASDDYFIGRLDKHGNLSPVKITETGYRNMLKAWIGLTPYNFRKTQEYQKVIDVNQLSIFLGMKAVLPSMKKQKNGSIVNISSIAGLVAFRDSAPYVASKFAVRGITKAAALEFAKYGIRVNSVHPGSIETPLNMTGIAGEMTKENSKFIPLGRFAKPEESSNLILFLASDESSYSTGSEFVIDGGLAAQ